MGLDQVAGTTIRTPCCWLHMWLSSIFLVLLFVLVIKSLLFNNYVRILCYNVCAVSNSMGKKKQQMSYSNYVCGATCTRKQLITAEHHAL